MRGSSDPYVNTNGDDNHNDPRRQLSIAAICSSTAESASLPPSSHTTTKQPIIDKPSSVLTESGVELCGCGCAQLLQDCSGCGFNDLCKSKQTYIL